MKSNSADIESPDAITPEMIEAGVDALGGMEEIEDYTPKEIVFAICRAMEKVRPDNWRPIETAPKDGTPILLSDGDSVTVAQFMDLETAIEYLRLDYAALCQQQQLLSDAAYHQVGREAFGARLVQISQMRLRNARTHWMPLPSAPKPAPENKHQDAPLMPVPNGLPIVIPGELAVSIEYSLMSRGSESSLKQAARLIECINQALRNAGLPEILEETKA